MCRMTMAIGDFDTHSLALGTQAMAEGVRLPHGARVSRHPNGWGMLHRTFGALGCTVRRDARPFGEIDVRREMRRLPPGVTVIHARHATSPLRREIWFTHPIERDRLAFFHNGFTPDIAALLGRSESQFDSAELFEFLVPDPSRLCVHDITRRLAEIGPNATAANCFIVAPQEVVVVNWFVVPEADYFTLWTMRDARGVVVASQILSEIAPPHAWSPLGHGYVSSLPIRETNHD